MTETQCLTCHVVHGREGCVFAGHEEEYEPHTNRAEYECERIRSRGHDSEGRHSWDVWE